MTTHTDLIARLRAYPTRDGVEAANALESLEQQVAALTKEKNDWYRYHGHVTDELVISQARETKLRGHMLNIASACRIWGGESERARKMLEECLALPTDDSALQERLAQERKNLLTEIKKSERYRTYENEDGSVTYFYPLPEGA